MLAVSSPWATAGPRVQGSRGARGLRPEEQGPVGSSSSLRPTQLEKQDGAHLSLEAG